MGEMAENTGHNTREIGVTDRPGHGLELSYVSGEKENWMEKI